MSTANKLIISEDRDAPIPEVQGDILHGYVNGDFQLNMFVPRDMIGRIMGKNGSVVKNIGFEAKTRRINVESDQQGGSLWMSIAIIGDWASIVRAYNALSDLVEGEVDEVVFEFVINYRKMFFLYGKFADPIISRISARTNVRIYFPEPPANHDYSKAEHFTLEGSFENVTKAVALLEEQALKYAEMMKERAATAELKLKKEKDPKDKREREKDTKEKEIDSDKAKLKVAPTMILERKQKPASSGPPAVEGTHSAAETFATRKSKENDAAKERPTKDETKKTKESSKLPIKSSGVEAVKETKQTTSASIPVLSKSNGAPPIAPTLSSSVVPSSSSAKATAAIEAIVATEQKPSAAEDKPQRESAPTPSEKVSRTIDVPFNIVGLLLSKKPRVKLSIMNQIQGNTRTIISKVINRSDIVDASSKKEEEKTKTKKEKTEKRRRRISEEDDSDDSDEESESNAADTDDNDDSESGSSESESAPVDAKNEPPVVFTIAGYSMDAVNAAYGYLERIIKGERIKEVLDSMPRRPRESKSEKSSVLRREDKSTFKSNDKRPRPVKSSSTSETVMNEDEKEKVSKDVSATTAGNIGEKVVADRPPKSGNKSKYSKGSPAELAVAANSSTTPIAPGVSDPSKVVSTPPVAPTLSDTIIKAEGKVRERGERKEKEKLTENSRAEGLKSTFEDKERGGRGGGRGSGRGRGDSGRASSGGRGRGRGPAARGPPPV